MVSPTISLQSKILMFRVKIQSNKCARQYSVESYQKIKVSLKTWPVRSCSTVISIRKICAKKVLTKICLKSVEPVDSRSHAQATLTIDCAMCRKI